MKYIKIYNEDFVNGPGLRTTVFLTGCNHRCPGCFNPETWDASTGTPFTEETLSSIIESTKPSFIDGITFTGGDPLYHGQEFIDVLKRVKESLPDKSIWVWTGYEYETIESDPILKHVLDYADVICVGPFKEDKTHPKKPYVGSYNQRVIDCHTREEIKGWK